MESKRGCKQLARDQELKFAAQLKERVSHEEEAEQRRVQELRAKQQEYVRQLRNQMDEQTKTRRLQGLMSDFEKKVNMRDIEAYENQEPQLHSKIVGVASPEKSVPAETLVPGPRPAVTEVMPITGQRVEFSISPIICIAVEETPMDRRVIEMALENMRQPEVAYVRHSTQNTAYGYCPGRRSCSSMPRADMAQENLVARNPLSVAGKSQIFNQGMPIPTRKQDLFAMPAQESSTGAQTARRYDTGGNMAAAPVMVPAPAQTHTRAPSESFSRYDIISGHKQIVLRSSDRETVGRAAAAYPAGPGR